MKDWVKQGLDSIEEMFPRGRLEKSRNRIGKIWQGRTPPDRYPVTYNYALFNMYNALHSPEQRLRASFDEFCIHGRLGDDFIPALFPGCRQSTIPNMFGAEEIVMDTDVSCKHIVFSKEDIFRLPEPSIGLSSVARMWLDMEEYFLEETGGRLPVHVADMQGPFDVCGQLMSYDKIFLLAYDSPEAVHLLMDKATQAFIMLWQAQKKLIGDLFIGTHLFGHSWVPPEFGASISIDSLVMYGPEFYTEFVQPSIEKIAEEFGIVSVHSCGDFSANVSAMCKTQGLAGINASQMSVDDLLSAGFEESKVVIVFSTPDSAASDFAAIRRNILLADISIDGMPWPESEGMVPHPSLWTDGDWNRLKQQEEILLQEAQVQ